MKIIAVTVTFNRLESLKKTLNAYSNSTVYPDTLIVVNNASTDDTQNYLENWKNKEEQFTKVVINLEDNLGGAGGFNVGISKAIELGCDWIFIGDDDAYINNDTIKKFQLRDEVNDPNIGAITCQVDSPDGIMLGHRRNVKKGIFLIHERISSEEDYLKDSFDINVFSFVGIFLNANFIKKIELPRKDFFIWYDDTEYSSRLSKISKIVCIPSLKIYHDCKFEDIRFCWKSYYGYRNKLVTFYNVYGKRYGYVFLIALKISAILDLIRNKKVRAKSKNDAILAFKNNSMGKNKKYMPGVFKI